MDAAKMGNKISTLRNHKGWTQKQLAEKLHVTDKAVSKWERGLCYPDLTLIEPLAILLEITVPELLGVEQGTSEEVVVAVTEIAKQEKAKIKKRFRINSWLNIVICCALIGAQVIASYIFAENELWGLPQIATMGMMGYAGVIIGNNIYTLRKLKEL